MSDETLQNLKRQARIGNVKAVNVDSPVLLALIAKVETQGSELAAARALLREVAKSIQEHDGGGIFDHEKSRIRRYLDATDTLGGE